MSLNYKYVIVFLSSFLHGIDASASIGAIDPLLLSSYPHFFKMIGSDNFQVASHHVLRNIIKIKQEAFLLEGFRGYLK